MEDNSDDADGDMLSVASNSKQPMDSWILDLACSFHMIPNRDWFDTYRSVNSGIVTMGNGAHCKITGMSNIRIKCLMVWLERYVMLDMYQKWKRI